MEAAAGSTTNADQPHVLPYAFPLRALLERMGSSAEAPTWASYLPSRPSQAASAAAASTHPRAAVPGASSRPQPEEAALPNLLHGMRQGSTRGSPPGSRHGSCREDQCLPSGSSSMPIRHLGCGGRDAGWRDASVAGRVWRLSQNARGSREVQHAMETASSEDARVRLASELRGHISEALRCPHANHVLQKCIECLSPHNTQFIIDELMARPGSISYAARHKYGCRIVQRLLESCLPQQVSGLIETLLADAFQIARHPYGNYVMQHLLVYGTADQKCRLGTVLAENAAAMGQDDYGSAVMTAAMIYSCLEQQKLLARAIVRASGLLLSMALARHGSGAARVALQVLEGPERQEAQQQLMAEIRSLRSSSYSRGIAALLEASA